MPGRGIEILSMGPHMQNEYLSKEIWLILMFARD